jgi:5-methylthioadenosine/S-adenosylhomocysteine deaminase
MATREGAAALHLETEIGTLEAGKAADIAVVEMDEWSMLPGGDPASRIVFGGSAQMVRHVVVAGRPVVVDGRLVTGDPDELRQRIAEVWAATRQRMESTS